MRDFSSSKMKVAFKKAAHVCRKTFRSCRKINRREWKSPPGSPPGNKNHQKLRDQHPSRGRSPRTYGSPSRSRWGRPLPAVPLGTATPGREPTAAPSPEIPQYSWEKRTQRHVPNAPGKHILACPASRRQKELRTEHSSGECGGESERLRS